MKKLGKITLAFVTVCIILSTGVNVMASTQKTSGKDKITKVFSMVKNGFIKESDGEKSTFNFETKLKTLVTAGVLTQTEADKILELSKTHKQARQAEMAKIKNMTREEKRAYFEAKKSRKPDKREDIFARAVLEGIISQEKADRARAKLHEIRRAERTANMTESLKGLVTAGTITQAQADKVIDYINNLEADKPAPGKLPKKEKKFSLSPLVDNGTLTQTQLDAITKVLLHKGGRGHCGK